MYLLYLCMRVSRQTANPHTSIYKSCVYTHIHIHAVSDGGSSGRETPIHSASISPAKHRISSQRTLPNGAIEISNSDGSKTITFKDGTVKEFTTDGRLVVRFCNGDVKEECPDGTVTYFYREARTVCMRVYVYMHIWRHEVHMSKTNCLYMCICTYGDMRCI